MGGKAGNKMSFKKIICVIAALAVTCSVFSGCNKNTAVDTQSSSEPKGEISYPIETDVTLKYWVRLSPALGTSVKNFGETEFAKEYMKRTGINVAYQHPAQGQDNEVLNLLIASGDLPDIIESDWLARDPDASIAKNTILSLNDYFKDYSPNLMKYLSENPDVDTAIRTDTGNYYVYPFIRGDEKLLSTAGLMLRNDWLSDLGLSVPETISEWEAVLEAFKSKCTTPLAMANGHLYSFLGAYGLGIEFFIENDKIMFGATDDKFKDFLAKTNEWYKKGYIDKNFAILDGKIINANMLDGKSGVTFGAGGGGIGTYLNAMKDKDPKYDLVAAPFPVLEKGQRPKFGNKQLKYSPLNGAAITGKSKNRELAARFLDYSYSEEGYTLNNFGVEGISYEMKDNYPTYKDVITNNPNGLAMSMALPIYVRAANEGPFVQDKRYIEQYYQLDQQKNALEVWSQNDHDKHLIPQITLTQAETSEFSKIMSEIRTYRDETIINFILGTKPIDEFSEYVEKVKSLKLDRAIEIEQASYDRYLNRK